MRRLAVFPVLGAAVLLTAVADSVRWNATLAATGGSTVNGTAKVESSSAVLTPGARLDSVKPAPPTTMTYAASAMITGATAGTSYAWMIHRGTCMAKGAVVGDASAYPTIRADAAGKGSATATITARLVDKAPYAVAVHEGGPAGDVVACGGLESAPTVP